MKKLYKIQRNRKNIYINVFFGVQADEIVYKQL